MSFSKYCEPCGENETQSIAIVWCTDCEQALCTSCQKVHRTLKATKTHHLVQKSDLPSGSSVCLTSYKACPNHLDFQIEFFCSVHDKVCCKSCITEKHRLCEAVVPIETAAKNVKESDLFENMSSDVSKMLKAIADLKAAKLKNERDIEYQAHQAEEKGAANKKVLLEQLNKIEKQMHSKIATLKKKVLSNLQSQNDNIEQLSDQITEFKEEIDFFRLHGSDVQTYTMTHFKQKLLQETITELKALISETRMQTFKFVPPSTSKLKISVGLGDIAVTSCKPVINLKLSGQQQAQAAKDIIHSSVTQSITTPNFSKKGSFSLTAPKSAGNKVVSCCIGLTRDDHILACDKSGNSTLALKYDKAGQLLDHCYLEGWANELKYIPDTDEAVVYIPGHRSIQFIDVRGMSAMGKTRLKESSGGLAVLNCQIYVGGRYKIFILNINGEVIDKINFGLTQSAVDIQYLHLLENKNILFAGKNGKLSYRFPDGTIEVVFESNSCIKGICSDKSQNVYFVESESGTVSVLPCQKGQHEVFPKAICGLDEPVNLSFNCDYTELCVVTNNGKNVAVYAKF